MFNLKLEPVAEGDIGASGEVCQLCFGMGESGTQCTVTRWAYGEPLPLSAFICDRCLIALTDALMAHVAAKR